MCQFLPPIIYFSILPHLLGQIQNQVLLGYDLLTIEKDSLTNNIVYFSYYKFEYCIFWYIVEFCEMLFL